MIKGYQYQSDFAKKYYAQGFEEELARQVVRSLLIVFRARGIAVPDSVRERILAEKNLERLRRWLEKAVVAPSIAEVFDEPS